MSAVTSQFIESIQHIPNDVEHPLELTAAVAAAGLGLAWQRMKFNRTEDEHAADFPNPALLESSIKPNNKLNRRTRLTSAAIEIVGLGLVVASVAGQPTYETSHVNSGANVIVVDDVSNSMRLTHDLGDTSSTRLEAVTAGINDSDYKGKLGVIQVASGHKLVLPLTSEWQKQTKKINKPVVDPNGGDIAPALQLAESLLPTSDKVDGGREGAIVLISDGTIDDPTSLNKQIAAIKHDGVEIKAVVPGTSTGTYTLTAGTQPVSSKAQPEIFAGLGNNNVKQAQDAKAVHAAVKEAIADAGSTHSKNTWLPPLVVGLGLFGFGFVQNVRQRALRKV